jgi:predicted dinucleotide-binding enzyme
MKIAVIGAGNVGRALGKVWLAKGHEVRFGVPEPGSEKYRDLQPAVDTLSKAASGAEVVVMAIPWTAVEDAIRRMGSLSGKIVIDCTNPLEMGSEGLTLALGYSDSAGERMARWAVGARVYKAFNTTGSANMENVSGYPVPAAMFVAGDESSGKSTVMALARDIGFEPIDAGPLRNARLLEPLAMLWIDQALYRGAGPDFVFTVMRKG